MFDMQTLFPHKFMDVSLQVHELPPEKLKQREVVHIDIANDPVAPADYKAAEDPKLFKSEKTGRGPLTGQWTDKVKNFSISIFHVFF